LHITKVQQWVAAILVFVVVGIGMSVPLAWVSLMMVDIAGRRGDAVGLWVMSAVCGAVTVAGMLLIHGRSVLSPHLGWGLLPAAVAAPLLF
jgi:hypothetical protein